MINYIKVDDLVWNSSKTFEFYEAESIASELKYNYPMMDVDYEATDVMEKSYPIYLYVIELTFKNESDEAEFILRESI